MTDEKKQMTIEDLVQEMHTGFLGMQEQFNGMQEQFNGMQEQFNGMQEQFVGQKQYMQQGFETLNIKIDLLDEAKLDKSDFDNKIDVKFEKMMKVIDERTFTPDEKEKMLSPARFIDTRLEEEARGENNIPLTRPEYDAVIKKADLPNRFLGGLETQQA